MSTMIALALFFTARKALKDYAQIVQNKRAREALDKILNVELRKDETEKNKSLVYLDDMTIMSSVDKLPIDMSSAQTFVNELQDNCRIIKFVSAQDFVIVKLSEERSKSFLVNKDELNNLIQELKEKVIFK